VSGIDGDVPFLQLTIYLSIDPYSAAPPTQTSPIHVHYMGYVTIIKVNNSWKEERMSRIRDID
jgi:hypothetical protein